LPQRCSLLHSGRKVRVLESPLFLGEHMCCINTFAPFVGFTLFIPFADFTPFAPFAGSHPSYPSQARTLRTLRRLHTLHTLHRLQTLHTLRTCESICESIWENLATSICADWQTFSATFSVFLKRLELFASNTYADLHRFAP